MLRIALSFAILVKLGSLVHAESGTSHFRDGYYIGIETGSAGYSIKGSTLLGDGGVGGNASEESAAVDGRTVLGSVLLGYEAKAGARLLWGFEGRLSQPANGALSTHLVDTVGSIYFDDTMAKIQYRQGPFLNLRGKLGVMSGRTMLYATLGVAFGRESQSRTQYRGDGVGETFAAFTETDNRLRTGATIGIGLRQAVNNDWSWSLEVQRTELNPEVFRFDNARGGVAGGFATVQGRLAQSSSRHDAVTIALIRKF